MSFEATIISLVILGVAVIGGIVGIIIAIRRGELKEFIEKKMIEAEQSSLSGKEKLAYVLEEVNKKYKLTKLFFDVKEFIEKIIDLSKQINCK